jgi:predicted AAA+ superfamily ATPase
MDKAVTDNVIYEKLLSDKLDTNLGYIYENMVSQIFRASGYELFYHTIKKDDGKSYYEVDFLLSKGNKLIPIEVKSSGYRAHTSLDKFCDKFSGRIGKKYLVYTKDLKKEGDILYLPIYMAMFV